MAQEPLLRQTLVKQDSLEEVAAPTAPTSPLPLPIALPLPLFASPIAAAAELRLFSLNSHLGP